MESIKDRINNITQPVKTLTRGEIENEIKKAISDGLRPVENKTTQAINAEHSIGIIHAYMFIIDRSGDFDFLKYIHDAYKKDIERLLNMVEVLYG